MSSICELPLLAGAVEIGTFVIEVPETLLEPRLGSSPYESVDERRAQIPVPFKQLEYLDIARGEFDPFSRTRSTHS